MKRFSSLLLTSLFWVQAFPVQANETVEYEVPQAAIQQFDLLESSGGIQVRDIRALKELGYDPSRTWEPGDTVADTIQLSDLNKITPITDQSYDQIFKSTGVQASDVKLGDTPLLKRQTIGDWIKANPNKANAALKGLPAMQQLIAGEWENSVIQGWEIASEHSEEFKRILEKHPELKDLPVSSIVKGDWKGTLPYAQQLALKEIDRHLPEHLKGIPGKSLGVVNDIRKGNIDRAAVGAVSIADAIRKAPKLKDIPVGALGDNVPVSAIPGLKETPIGQLAGWEGSKVSETPGLKDKPLDYVSLNTVIGLLNGDLFGALDVPRSEAELAANNPISGGTRGGPLTPEPCRVTEEEEKQKTSKASACPNIELQDVDSKKSLGGKQWVSGKYQKVKGGRGFLKKFNGGWEPTGLKPWGPKPPLKLVLMEVTETDGKQIQTDTGITVSEKAGYGKFAMYAQFCVKKGFVDLGCSPHFIGPIPFVLHPKVRQNGRVLIASSSGPPPIPDEWQRRIDGYAGQYQCGPAEGPGEPQELGEKKYGYRPIASADEADLVTIGQYHGYDQRLHKEAATAWEQMQQAAAEDGVRLGPGSAHRSTKLQGELFAAQTQRQGSPEAAAKLSAPSGHSEHHSGYALDIIDLDAPEADLKHSFGDTKAYEWLKENGSQYGWEQSYDGSHEGLTTTEEWHWSYTQTDSAKRALNRVETHHDGHDHDGHDHDAQAHDGHDNRKAGDAVIESLRKPENEREKFVAKAVALAKKYKVDPVDVLTVMSFETKGTFRPNIFNESGSGAVGLIQFMPATARGLGTSTQELTQMSRVEQLDWVDRYFADVGIQPGDDLPTLYASVLTGARVGDRNLSDGSYTVNTAVRDMEGHRQKAIALLKGAGNLDTSGYTFQGGGGSSSCVAGTGGGGGPSGPFVQGDGKTRGNFINPAPGPITSIYGWRTHPRLGGTRFHKGIDIGLEEGTPVKAADGGVVIYRYNQCIAWGDGCGGPDTDGLGKRSGFGNRVEIRHADGSTTAYNHLKQAIPPVGSKVSQGQVIGTVGSTGISTGPHLDFQIYPDGVNHDNLQKYINF